MGDDDFDQALGFRLRTIRQKRRVSQEALGAFLGITFQQVQKYESGATRMPPERLAKCATYFDVPVGYFFGMDHAPQNKDAQFDQRVLSVATAIAELPSPNLIQQLCQLVRTIGETTDGRNQLASSKFTG